MARKVTANTKLSTILKLNQELLEYFVALNPHDFARLRKPLIRRLMTPRITLRRLATMTGQSPNQILKAIQPYLLSEDIEFEESEISLPQSPETKPDWATEEPDTIIDLLECDERLDADPMLPINRATCQLKPGILILVKHKWEPQPLYDVWAKIGVEFFTEAKSENEVWIYLRKASGRV